MIKTPFYNCLKLYTTNITENVLGQLSTADKSYGACRWC